MVNSFIDKFLHAASICRDKIAVADDCKLLSFGQLEEKSRRLAQLIISKELGTNPAVLIILDDCTDYLVAQFGVWLAGGAIVPLSESYPKERIASIKEQACSKFTIDSAIMEMVEDYEPLSKHIQHNITDNFAIFFTSGSTGEPKGIVHTIDCWTDGIDRSTPLNCKKKDIYANNVPFYFVAQFILFPYLLAGATIRIIPTAMRRDMKLLPKYLKEHGITSLFISPSALPYFEINSSALRQVLTGSERLSGVAPKGYELIVLYGLSETLPLGLYFKVEKAYENTPIGVPFPNVNIRLFDDQGKDVAKGEEGEICLEGVFTSGYLHQQEATEKLYKYGILHTNDIGKELEDGTYIYVNRKDWMLKINGQRVEPGEVESVIKQVDNIENAIVKGFEIDGKSFICAYYIGKGIDIDELKIQLSKKLPSYMLPSYFVEMDVFPVNQNGKLDRKSLKPPLLNIVQEAYIAPQTEEERKLCKAFESIFKIDKISVNDDFFMLGGDSISIMKLQTIVSDLKLNSQIIFKGRTPREIAKLCKIFAIPELENLDSYPLSKTQIGIYIECANRKGEICYNIPRLFTLSKSVDLNKLANAIDRVIEAHSYVLTKIERDDNGDIFQTRQSRVYRQVIEEVPDIESVKSNLAKPFDLDCDALFRIRLFDAPKYNYLFIDFHHIIFDGSSFEVFIRDINKAYKGETLAAEELSGYDISLLENKRRESELYAEAKLWHEKMYDGVDVDSLPITDQKEQMHGFGKEMLLTTVTTKAISAFCVSNNISENVFFNAAFSYFLAAYNSTNEALYATIYNGRNDARSLNSIAMLVKTLMVYQDLSKIESVKDLIKSVQTQLLGAMNNDLFSFAQVSEKFGFTSNLLFAYQGDLHFDNQLCGEDLLMEDLLENSTGETLSLQVFKEKEHFALSCEFKRDIYTNKLIQEFLLSFDKVIDEFLVKEKLNDIGLISEIQIKSLDTFNDTERDYDKSLTVLDLIHKRTEEAPESLAVVYKDRKYTYIELEQISNNLAGYILESGLKREDVVAILIPRSEYMAIAPLGVLKANCAYQPLDHTYPPERLEFMLEDSSAKLLIADESLLELVPNYKGRLLLTKDIKSLPKVNPSIKINPSDAFNLLYTSGSTGLPKGCIIEHKNITAFVNNCKNIYELTPEDNTTAYASFGFDASMWETFMSLCWGCTLHIIADDIRLNLIGLESYFIENKIAVSFMTTQVGRQFALSIGDTTLRHFSTGGEKLVALEPPHGFTLHNCYGPTEATVFVTRYPLTRKENNIPIGKIVENMKSYIVNRVGQRQPIGGIGELWVAGEQVARGYLNRPDITSSVFIDNPFSEDKSYKRVYRTGDIVRYLGDGNIEFIGRRDAQVKIRGFRIELTEVEAIIREFPSVKDATVQAYDMEGGGKYIAAFIVGDTPIEIEALKEFVLENKPPYILPSVIMQIDTIPLNQNQKVNKKALPKPELTLNEEDTDSKNDNRPLNILEEEIKSIVAGIINSDQIGLTTKFVYAGLTSISSIKLATLLYKRFDVYIDTKKLSKEYCILDVENLILADILAGSRENRSKLETKREKIREYYPLSYSQLGVYYECMKNPTKTTYNIPLYLSYPKSIPVQKIIDSVRHIIDINPYLLTRFGTKNTEIVQHVAKDDYIIKHIILEGKELESFKQNYVQPYNLQKDTLFRIACVESKDFNYLFLDFHHLIFDGASCDLFIRQLNSLLDGNDLDGVNIYSYFNYIDDEKSFEKTLDYKENESYFASRLQYCEGGTMIQKDLNSDTEYGNLASIEALIQSDNVNEFCKSMGVSAAEFYLAATIYTISRYANTKDVYLSTISNGRSDIKRASTYGMMVKTLPIASFIKDQSVCEYIVETATDFENTLKHENYPYVKLAADYNFSPEIMYAYQVGVLNEYRVGNQIIAYDSLGLTVPKFKLSIHIESRNNKDCIVLEYNDALYTRDLMEMFADSLNTVISHFITHSERKVKHISILSNEQAVVLESFRNIAEDDKHLAYYYSGLEHCAATIPEHTALIATDAQYTYGELNEKINKLANLLIDRGIKIGDRVALLLPRTSELIISMYGVSKAGAAYIPCDVEYPKERIAHILEDSNASYIITTKDRVKEFAPGLAIDVETLLQNDNIENPCVNLSIDDLSYIIYTSGSTGKPKGVLLTHKGISNYTYNHPANSHVYALVNDATRYLSVTTISFDMSLKEIATTLCNGLTLILANEDEANNPILLSKLLESSKADAFNATPSRMLQYMELDAFCLALSNCKIVMSGGEKFSGKLLTRLKEVTKARIFNTYGPTEITVSSNAKEMTNESVISIGSPLLNYTEFIVDCDGNELPRGVVGELYIGGVGVALGYNNLEEMTKERFITYKGIRVYRSGDYASWDKSGNVLIHGRTDNQVKLRGLRIELGEIESAISKFDGIKNVVVIIREIKGKEHIAAYFIADKEVDVIVLREELSKTLTSYMIPTAYMQMDKLPQTPNGKIDIKVLPEAYLFSTSCGEEATNEVEQTFCDMFAEILELDKVGATDSFFEIGGSSLIATRLIIEASKAGYEIAYGDIFENPSPRELAILVGAEVKSEDNEFDEIKNFDYTILQSVLETNTLENFKTGTSKCIKHVLLTGATGFLGIHMLKELIGKDDVYIHCLLRGKDGITAEQRLKTMLFYYFENSYEELFGKCLFIVNADLNKDTVLNISGIDTVINCAAIVKHFAEGTEIYDVNVGGTNALIKFCLNNNARLIHISTMSVNGFSLSPMPSTPFKEQDLYIGQYINNKYIHSKFIAERNILENIAINGLDAKIMRVGNLSARNSDGEFQINFNTNSFMNRLKVFNLLGICPYEELDSLVEFSPIDEVAKSILLLAKTPKECCIFHPYNNHMIFKGDIFDRMSHLGIQVKPGEMSAYLAQIDALKNDVEKAKNLTSVIAYENMGNGKEIVPNLKHNNYTMQVLYRLDYRWPVTSWDYIERFVEVLLGFGYFN